MELEELVKFFIDYIVGLLGILRIYLGGICNMEYFNWEGEILELRRKVENYSIFKNY